MKKFIVRTLVFTALATCLQAGPMETSPAQVEQSTYQPSQE